MARRTRPEHPDDAPDPDPAHEAAHRQLREENVALRAERDRLRAREQELRAELRRIKRDRRGGG